MIIVKNMQSRVDKNGVGYTVFNISNPLPEFKLCNCPKNWEIRLFEFRLMHSK